MTKGLKAPPAFLLPSYRRSRRLSRAQVSPWGLTPGAGNRKYAEGEIIVKGILSAFGQTAVLCLLLVGPGCRTAPSAAGVPPAADGEVDVRIFLAGDAGWPDPAFEPLLASLALEVGRDPARSVVIFLGDNIYPSGMPTAGSADRGRAEGKLASQIEAVLAAGAKRVFFIAGNHDWGSGLDGIVEEDLFIETRGRGRARLLPRGGCPGPESERTGTTVDIVAVDTQWLLNDPPASTGGCDNTSREEVLAALGERLAGGGERLTLLLGHHPVVSGGMHSGSFGWQDHIFPLRHLHSSLWVPLPLLGSLYPLSRKAFPSPQDLRSPRYRRLREDLLTVLGANPPLIYASGHDHSLQVLRGEGLFHLVSGGGIYGNTTPVTDIPETLFAEEASGFMRIDVLVDLRARLAVYRTDETGKTEEAYSLWLR